MARRKRKNSKDNTSKSKKKRKKVASKNKKKEEEQENVNILSDSDNSEEESELLSETVKLQKAKPSPPCRYFEKNFFAWRNHMDDFVHYCVAQQNIPLVPFTEKDLQALGYDRIYLSVDAVKEYYAKHNSVEIPPLYEDEAQNRSIMILYNLFLSTLASTNEPQRDDRSNTSFPVKKEMKLEVGLVKEENTRSLPSSIVDWSTVTKHNFSIQLRIRIVQLCNQFALEKARRLKGESKIESFNKNFIKNFCKMKSSPYSYFQGALIAMGIAPEKTKKMLLNCVAASTISQSLPQIKTDSLSLLKKEWSKVDTKSAAHEIKSLCKEIFFDFLRYHHLE